MIQVLNLNQRKMTWRKLLLKKTLQLEKIMLTNSKMKKVLRMKNQCPQSQLWLLKIVLEILKTLKIKQVKKRQLTT